MEIKNRSISNKKKKFASTVESLDECDYEDDEFIEGDLNIGTPLASFNFVFSMKIAIFHGKKIRRNLLRYKILVKIES